MSSLFFRFVAAFCCMAFLVFQPAPVRAAASEDDHPGDHHDSPVFFELYKTLYFDYDGMQSLRQNRLKIPDFPEVDLTDFDWNSGGINDYSWWARAERLVFLLPFIDSERETDRELAKKWFTFWYNSHKEMITPNKAAWHDPFVVAYRAMVLVFYLKTEEDKPNPSERLIEMLRLSIFDHQLYLLDENHFERDSNHGLVEAIALIEVTRVARNHELTVLGMDRALSIIDVSVSDVGCHMEHSPGYAFSFLRWVGEIHDYCKTIRSIPPESFGRLAACWKRMQWTAYFMYDHRCNLPQIGDTDSVVVGESYPGKCVAEPDHDATALYDPEAGYAIYKGHPSTDDRRYVVFTIQNELPELRFHYHDDALAVFYSYDGEVILGDQGKYEYTFSSNRQYFASPAAHNTIFPAVFLSSRKGRYNVSLAAATSIEENDETVQLAARIEHLNDILVARKVTIQKDKKTLCLVDTVWSLASEKLQPAISSEGGSRSATNNRTSPEPQRLAMVWNFGRDVTLIRSKPRDKKDSIALFLETRGGRRFRMSIDFDGDYDASSKETELARGEFVPMRGWYSPAMRVMRPVPALIITFVPTGVMSISTAVDFIANEELSGDVLFTGE